MLQHVCPPVTSLLYSRALECITTGVRCDVARRGTEDSRPVHNAAQTRAHEAFTFPEVVRCTTSRAKTQRRFFQCRQAPESVFAG